MAETATTIKELDANQPPNNIVLLEEDDQLRLIKIVEKLTFAGVGGNGFNTPITATEADLNNLVGLTSNIESQLTDLRNGQVPIGGIINFLGVFGVIPSNFKLCDGANGTPNLTNRFVKATVSEAALLITGGSTDSVNVSHNHQADHNHVGSTSVSGAHNHTISQGYPFSITMPLKTGAGDLTAGSGGQRTTENAGGHIHTAAIPSDNTSAQTTGVSPTNANMPVYYKAAFIMRIS